jgi:hypothetical protein
MLSEQEIGKPSKWDLLIQGQIIRSVNNLILYNLGILLMNK